MSAILALGDRQEAILDYKKIKEDVKNMLCKNRFKMAYRGQNQLVCIIHLEVHI